MASSIASRHGGVIMMLASGIEAERQLLGCYLQNAPISKDITVEVFSTAANKTIFKTISELRSKDVIIDLVILSNELTGKDKLLACGGLDFIASLTNGVLPSNVEYYESQILENCHRKILWEDTIRLKEALEKGENTEILQNTFQKHANQSLKTQAEKRKTQWTALELVSAEFAPLFWFIPYILTIGLTVLAGAPKLGKSWLLLGWALAISCGGIVMGNLQCKNCGVLLLSLEDTPRRLQERIRKLNMPCNDNLHIFTEWTTGETGLISFLKEHPEVKCIFIDTWGRFARLKDHNDYGENTNRAATLKQIADQFEVAIVVCHHCRKTSNNNGGI